MGQFVLGLTDCQHLPLRRKKVIYPNRLQILQQGVKQPIKQFIAFPQAHARCLEGGYRP